MSNHQKFYIRFRGMVTGPVDYPTLLEQVNLGRITKLHELSTDGRTFKSAGQIAPKIFDPNAQQTSSPISSQPAASSSRPKTNDADIRKYPPDPMELPSEYFPATAAFAKKLSIDKSYSARACYILAGLLLLIDALLPGTTAEGNPRWLTAEFSDGFKQVALTSLAGLIAALCCIFFCGVSNRTTRGWMMLCLGAAGGFFAGLCAATISMGWYVFIAASSIFVSALAVAAAIGAFAGRAHKPLGIIACVYAIIAGLVTMIGLDQFGGGKFSAGQSAAAILAAGGFLMMFISSCAAVIASTKNKTPFDPNAASPAPREYKIAIHVKSICVSAGFLTASWAMLAASTFFLLPVAEAENPDAMTSLPLLRFAIGAMCLAVIAAAGVFEIISSSDDGPTTQTPRVNESLDKGCQHDDTKSTRPPEGRA